MKWVKSTVALISSLLVSSTSLARGAKNSIVDIVVGSPEHTTLASLVTQADLVKTLSSCTDTYTLFAPANNAFASLGGAADKYLTPDFSQHLVDILAYHLVDGKVTSADLALGEVNMANGGSSEITSLSPPKINSASIIAPFDISASNGVVHSTDAVLLPTSVTSDIVDIASSADAFSTLVNLVVDADLVDTLKGEGPFTVFAPTNAAFEELSEETVTFLTSAEGKDQLIDILTYHVVPGVVYASDVSNSGEVTMANGDIATVMKEVDSGAITVNDANVVLPQILASNGVIHPIDKIILPNA